MDEADLAPTTTISLDGIGTVEEVERAHAVAEDLQRIQIEIKDRFVDMGELLLEAFRKSYHKHLGFKNFETFVNEQLHMSYRTAKYMLDCYSVFIEDLNVSKEEVTKIGWSKLKELLPVVNAQNVQSWVDLAGEKPVQAIKDAVHNAQYPVAEGEPIRKQTTLTIFCFDDEKEKIEAAINLGKMEGQTDRAGRALFLICEDYSAAAVARQVDAAGGEAAIEEVN